MFTRIVIAISLIANRGYSTKIYQRIGFELQKFHKKGRILVSATKEAPVYAVSSRHRGVCTEVEEVQDRLSPGHVSMI